MTGALHRLGRSCARHPWRTLLAWLAAVLTVITLSVIGGGTLRDQMTVPGTSSDRATSRLVASFPAEAGAEAHVVAQFDGAVDWATVDPVTQALGRLDGVRAVQTQTSSDGRTVMLVVRYHAELADIPLQRSTVELEAAAQPLADAGARMAVGGQVPEAIQGPNGLAETIGVLIALAILLITFGSVVAAGLPLIVAGFALGAGTSLILVLAAVTDVNTVSPTLGAMIGLGVSIDYALFVVARFRERLMAGDDRVAAAAHATATAGRSVVYAGGTVLIGITGLAFSGVPSFASMGFAAGLVVACAVLVSITLLPGLLGAAGHRVFGRRVRRGRRPASALHSPWAERWARRIVRRPLAWLLASTVLLVALAIPALDMRLGQNDAGSENTAKQTRQAFDLVAGAFGPGANGPLTFVADRRLVPERELTASHRRVETTTGVASVSPIALSPDGVTAVFQAVPSTAPQDDRTHDLVRRLQSDLPAGVDITGPTAAIVDMTGVLSGHLWLVIAAVLAATFALLVFVFRSLVLPVKAVLTNLLSIGAAFGLMTLVFQTELGARLLGLPGPVPIAGWAPVVLFAILFGLSMDYEVFLLTRVREVYERTRDTTEAVVVGTGAIARIITSAAGIMIAVAVGFALDPSVMVKIIGVGMATAILVDVTIARLILVPAAVTLLGTRNWYMPRWLGGQRPPVDAASPVPVSYRPTPDLDEVRT